MTEITARERLLRRLEDLVRRFVEAEGMRPADGRLLVAVSSGPDSSALLVLLSRLAPKLQLELTAAYFDHGLRGPDAAREERGAVEKLCAALEVPLLTGAGDVREEARRSKRSLEDAARRMRYAFFASAADEARCKAVATGHTASDQAETVLLNLIRGTGLPGLGGIAPSAPFPLRERRSLRVLRPLLCLSRADTTACCEAAGIDPVMDESNLSPAYRRNRVRNEVLPLLRSLNPRVDDALVRLAEAVRPQVGFLETMAQRLVAVGHGEARINRDDLPMDDALFPYAVRYALRKIVGDIDGIGARHIDAIARLGLHGRTGDRLDLPGGVVATLTHDELLLTKDPPMPPALPGGPVTLPVPGEVRFGGLIVSAGLPATDFGAVCTAVDAAAAGTMLVVRRRRDGDRMQPLGMSGTKKLQDLFVDARLPRARRDAVPIFENERGIVWAGGVRVAEWARARPDAPSVTLSYRQAP